MVKIFDYTKNNHAGLDNEALFHYNNLAIGVWRSLVSRLVRVQEASGSNPDTPTNGKSLETQRVSRLFLFGDTLCELHQNTKSAQKSAQLSEKAFESRRCTARKGVSYGSNPREQKEW